MRPQPYWLTFRGLLTALILALALAACGGGDGPTQTAGGESATKLLAPPVTVGRNSLRVTPATSSLNVGNTVTLSATMTASGQNARTPPVQWTSSNPAVATVGATSGVVIAIAPGTATITAKAGGLSGTATVSVSSPTPAMPTRFLTFDEFSDGTNITNQYADQGITVTGAAAFDADFLPYPAYSPPQVVFSPEGTMTFTFNPNVTGPIPVVSLYFTGDAGTRIQAYDAANNLVGEIITQTQPQEGAAPTFYYIASNGGSITKLVITDGVGNFIVDSVGY